MDFKRNTKGKILNLQEYRIKKQVEAEGLEWLEDEHGKFKIWIRLKKEPVRRSEENLRT